MIIFYDLHMMNWRKALFQSPYCFPGFRSSICIFVALLTGLNRDSFIKCNKELGSQEILITANHNITNLKVGLSFFAARLLIDCIIFTFKIRGFLFSPFTF